MPLPKPDYYTEIEGGKWKRWPSECKFDIQRCNLWRKSDNAHGILFDKIVVVSLLFGDPRKLAKSLRWDCINGWNVVEE